MLFSANSNQADVGSLPCQHALRLLHGMIRAFGRCRHHFDLPLQWVFRDNYDIEIACAIKVCLFPGYSSTYFAHVAFPGKDIFLN